MPDKIVTLSPKAIETEGLQFRAEMSAEHVESLTELFDEQAPTWPDGLPPVGVYHDGRKYYCWDGHHSLAAAIAAGCTEVRVSIRRGGREEAIKAALGANARHGLTRTPADKRHAVLMAKKLFPEETNRGIARLCNVSHGMVDYTLREEVGIKDKNGVANLATPNLSQIPDVGAGGAGPDAAETADSVCPADPGPERSGSASPAQTDNAGPECPTAGGDVTAPLAGIDASGSALSVEAQAAFASLGIFDQVEKSVRLLAQQISALGHQPGGELYRAKHLRVVTPGHDGQTAEVLYSPDLKNVLKELQGWRPYAICPLCQDKPKQLCRVCKGLPYVTEDAFARCPEDKRKAALARMGKRGKS